VPTDKIDVFSYLDEAAPTTSEPLRPDTPVATADEYDPFDYLGALEEPAPEEDPGFIDNV